MHEVNYGDLSNNIWIFLKKVVYVRIMIESMLCCVVSKKLWKNPITILWNLLVKSHGYWEKCDKLLICTQRRSCSNSGLILNFGIYISQEASSLSVNVE